jgi:hypothetical protein
MSTCYPSCPPVPVTGNAPVISHVVHALAFTGAGSLRELALIGCIAAFLGLAFLADHMIRKSKP